MATLKTIYKGNLRTEITHLQSGGVVITDAPTDNNGKGESISPTDMVSAALGSCILTIIGMAAMNHGFDIDGTEIETSKIMSTNPRRIGEIHLTINFPHDYEPRFKRLIEAAVKSCPVEQSLHPDIKRTITYNYKNK